jgi:hypothetical protein
MIKHLENPERVFREVGMNLFFRFKAAFINDQKHG